ncbi:hypothetical protein M409DRAFT_15672 [Zasmidium cellare ATCC 36951]|uniref:2',3'-cyclic-nucleotide 3'-phosphodiesterase n=1 Tax=Zasmidium cellare ATCC 36951 TaxID=1080233 RepID=A0A6A6D1T5_ZASCE|nr:uncharacterized protein M409DRAFT_15672 [Zasmidium cellare ATCC 36951]KAF2173387.1 hypothetical protein M409DRAFT_15672 [Zasmidium cellare ATCC 36951]
MTSNLSLWLVPNENSPFSKTAQELISDTVPRNFVSQDEIQHFPPHVTVTGELNAGKAFGGKSPQEWLDSIDFSAYKPGQKEVVLELDTVEAEDPFFRKMNISVKESEDLRQVSATSRRAAGLDEAWSKNEYRPHLSLFYGDVATQQVKAKVPLIEMKIGFALGDLFACCGGTLCMGGYIVVVDTRKPIREWKDAIVAKRETPWAMWRATRNLI